MKSLVIGSTSQLSHYFPEEFVKISSRRIDFSSLKRQNWDKIILAFGESRKFIETKDLYIDINFHLTIKAVEELKDICNTLIVYSTCELWNKHTGQIDMSMPFMFYETPYLESKLRMTCYLFDKSYKNVFVMFPFNFNSLRRNDSFLFGKVFNSIISKRKIEIGNTYFYRDLIHPSLVVNESISAIDHKIIGSGRLTFVNDFIRDIYKSTNLQYEEFVDEHIEEYKEYNFRNEYYLRSKNCLQTYQQLFELTMLDLRSVMY